MNSHPTNAEIIALPSLSSTETQEPLHVTSIRERLQNAFSLIPATPWAEPMIAAIETVLSQPERDHD